jgi:hypothetical protein
MSLYRRFCIITLYRPVVLALLCLTGCSSLLPTGSTSHPAMPAAGRSLTQAATASGVFAVMTWAGVALVAAGIVSWMMGNRTRALLMIACGAAVSVGTLLALEIASMLIWPALIGAMIIGATLLVGWGWPKWRKVFDK